MLLPGLPCVSTQAEQADTLRTIDIDDIVIIARPKENRLLRELPTAGTQLTQQDMRAKQVTGIKSLTAVVPNLFIPDYGSNLTTAVYIRGIGSRINTPAVGLYVDNIPYIDKSAFDFNYADIEQIEVLRGPQSMLYGRNTMGGLIKVQTKSPFTYQGTDIRMGAATYGDAHTSVTHYHRISPRFAFSAGGFYEHAGGFFKNSFKNNERIDRGNSGGGRLHSMFLPTPNLKIDLNLSYEYTKQGAYPYYYLGAKMTDTDTDDNANADDADYLYRIAYPASFGKITLRQQYLAQFPAIEIDTEIDRTQNRQCVVFSYFCHKNFLTDTNIRQLFGFPFFFAIFVFPYYVSL